MRPAQFSDRKTGKIVEVAGAPGITHAFLPDPLPAAWEWPTDLWPLLLEARTALATLDGTGKHLPDPRLALRPLQHREAQKSSSLEGTYTDPREQLLFELEPEVARSSDDPVNARREVFNYARALRHRKETQNALPLSLRLIRELHSVLMDGVRGAGRDPGNFRRSQNQVGRPARYVPPPVNLLDEALDRFEKYLHTEKHFDPLVEAFIVHYQFEAIHPFMDGNGRVGRLLLAITIEEWCRLSNQWLYMSAYFDRNRDEYIDRLFRVSTEGAWSDWIEFCLRGVVETTHDTIRRCDRLIDLNRDFHERVHSIGGSVRLARIMEDLFITPVAVVAKTRRLHGVSYPTARRDLDRLHEAEILAPLEGASQISYFCPEIMEIIYGDEQS